MKCEDLCKMGKNQFVFFIKRNFSSFKTFPCLPLQFTSDGHVYIGTNGVNLCHKNETEVEKRKKKSSENAKNAKKKAVNLVLRS